MLSIPGNRVLDCDGITRREFMRIGGAAMLGLSLPEFLALEARAAGLPVLVEWLLPRRRAFGWTGQRDWLCFCWKSRFRQRLLKSDSQDLVHGVHEVQLHSTAQVFRHLSHVLLIVFRKDDFEQSGAVRCQ